MDETTVHSTLMEILDTSDLNSITLRQVMEQVENKLGSPSKTFKTFIKRTVDDYLGNDAGHTPNKKAKTDPGSNAAAAAAQSAPKGEPATDADPPDTDGVVQLSDKRSALLSTFKGKTRLDIREFYVDSNTGERKHSSKGLAMPIDQVDTLLAAMPDIQAAVDGGTDLSINLLANGLRRVTVSRFKSSTLVSLREYYNDKNTGEAKPGKKGISLSTEQWRVLCRHLPALAAALRKAGG